ncbi:MAG: hypothetical protein IKO53_05030 [Lachnospiraceae bacterium]|nr:hypothetical protein [Lachnospiraceae bacterium]
MKNLYKKVTSRKFIVTAVLVAAGLGAAFKETNNDKLRLAGCVIAGVAGIAYAVIEGKIDAASVKAKAQEVLQAFSAELISTEGGEVDEQKP